VLGPLASNRLGPTDYHEHLFQVSPLLVGDELDDEPAGRAEAADLHRSGFAAMVTWRWNTSWFEPLVSSVGRWT
jgi:phosphotriesterase-related protein